MKRFILFLIINSSLCIMHCAAQYPEYSIGVRGGTSWSFMLFNPSVAQPTMPMTFHAGAQFQMVSERYFGIKLELNYAQRGFKDKEGHRRLDYIELPVMTHITFGQKLFRFFVDLGPEISYMIKDNPISAISTQHSSKIKNHFDYGLVGGLGL